MGKSIGQILKEMQERITVLPSSETTAATEYNCHKCKDQLGWIEERESEISYLGSDGKSHPMRNQVWVECSCVKQKKINRLLKSSAITDEFQKMTFGNFQTDGYPSVIKKMYDTAFHYCQTFNSIKNTRCNSIALIGQPGAGKTHLLSAVANNMMIKWQIPALYFPYVEGMEDLKADFNKPSDQVNSKNSITVKLQRLKEVEVLFIDDLFKPVSQPNPKNPSEPIKIPRATPWQVEKMFEVINYRYLNNKPLLISSELSFDDMLGIDEALCTRIFEMCSDYTVTIKKDISLNHRLLKMREAK